MFCKTEKLIPTLHQNSVYELLYEFPGARLIANTHLTRLSNHVETTSKGHYTKEIAIAFRKTARASIGSYMPAKSLELKHTIKLIRELDTEIEEIENEIKTIMVEIISTILNIPGISHYMGAINIAEIGDLRRFDSPDKILAYTGMSPSTYQSRQLVNCHSRTEKRGS